MLRTLRGPRLTSRVARAAAYEVVSEVGSFEPWTTRPRWAAVEQLVYEGFTQADAEHGTGAVFG